MQKGTPTKTLGDTIRKARHALGWSIRHCAAAAGVDTTWLSRLERGDYTSPDPRHLQQVASRVEN